MSRAKPILKLLGFFFAIAITVVALSVYVGMVNAPTAAADASGSCGNNCTWQYDSSTKTLTICGSGNMDSYSSSSNQPWASYRSSITRVVIESGITSIGERAFYDFTKLTSVSIAQGVTIIEEKAFKNCSSLLTITIPNSVTEMQSSIFNGCSKLQSMTLPFGGRSPNPNYLHDGVYEKYEQVFGYIFGWSTQTSNSYNSTFAKDNNASCYYKRNTGNKDSNDKYIYEYTYYCYQIPSTLTTVTFNNNGRCGPYGIDDSVVDSDNNISCSASLFRNTKNITTVTIGDGITTFPNYIFYNSNVAHVNIGAGITEIGNYELCYASALVEISIPSTVTRIAAETSGMSVASWYRGVAFEGCSSLRYAYIDCATIGKGAFYNCSNLKEIVFGPNVRTVETNSFYDCTGLERVFLNEGLISIATYAFGKRNTNNTVGALLIPSTVTTMEEYIASNFSNNSNNISFFTPHSANLSGWANKWNYEGSAMPTSYNSNFVTVHYSYDGATSQTPIYDVISLYPNNLKLPSTYAPQKSGATFLGWKQIIDSQNNVSANYITEGCTWNSYCPNDTVTLVAIWENSKGLQYYEYDNKVVIIGCNKSKANGTINLATTSSTCSNVVKVETNALNAATEMTSLAIPASLTDIGDDAFINCKKLASITVNALNPKYRSENNCLIEGNKLILGCKNSIIPDSVTSIGNNAFRGCSEMTAMTIPDSVKTIGASAFEGCTNLTDLNSINGYINFIPQVTSIGYNAFKDTPLSAVYGSAQTYSTDATYQAYGRIQFYGDYAHRYEGGNAAGVDCTWFYGGGLLYVFGGPAIMRPDPNNPDYTSVNGLTDAPWGISKIRDNAKLLVIGDDIIDIGTNAFYGLNNLKRAIIGRNVNSLGKDAFWDCSKLANIYFTGSFGEHFGNGHEIQYRAFGEQSKIFFRINYNPTAEGWDFNAYMPANTYNVWVYAATEGQMYNEQGEKLGYDVQPFGESAVVIQLSSTANYQDEQGIIYSISDALNEGTPATIIDFGPIGIRLDSIVIPQDVIFYYEDGDVIYHHPVTTVASTAFANVNSSVIKSITVGENVTIIEAGAFSGCANLEYIRMNCKPTVFKNEKDENGAIIPENVSANEAVMYKVPAAAYFVGLTDCGWTRDIDTIAGHKVYIADKLTANEFDLSEDTAHSATGKLYFTLSIDGTAIVGKKSTTAAVSPLDSTLEDQTNYVRTAGDVGGEVVIPDYVFDGYSIYKVVGFDRFAFYRNSKVTKIQFGPFIGSGETEDCPAIWDCTFRETTSLEGIWAKGNDHYRTYVIQANGEHGDTPQEGYGALYGRTVDVTVQIQIKHNNNSYDTTVETVSLPTRLIKVPDTTTRFKAHNYATVVERYALAGNNRLISINLNNINIVGAHAFYNCTSLTTVEGSAVQYIEAYAFYNCNQLQGIDLSNCILIGQSAFTYAFNGTGDATTITIRKDIAYIGEMAFANSGTIAAFVEGAMVEGNTQRYQVIDDVLFAIGDNDTLELLQYPAAKTIKTPASPNAEDVYDMTDMNIVSIAPYAFRGAKYLNKVTLSDSTVEVGTFAFYGCLSLKKITLGAAFAGFNNGSLGYQYDANTFNECPALTDIKVKQPTEDNPNYVPNKKYMDDDGVLYSIDKTVLYRYPAGRQSNYYTVPSGVTTIADYAFSGNVNLRRVMLLSRELTELGGYAFIGCGMLEELYFKCDYVAAPYSLFGDVSVVDPNVYFYYEYAESWRSNVVMRNVTVEMADGRTFTEERGNYCGRVLKEYRVIQELSNSAVDSYDYVLVIMDSDGSIVKNAQVEITTYVTFENGRVNDYINSYTSNDKGIVVFSMLTSGDSYNLHDADMNAGAGSDKPSNWGKRGLFIEPRIDLIINATYLAPYVDPNGESVELKYLPYDTKTSDPEEAFFVYLDANTCITYVTLYKEPTILGLSCEGRYTGAEATVVNLYQYKQSTLENDVDNYIANYYTKEYNGEDRSQCILINTMSIVDKNYKIIKIGVAQKINNTYTMLATPVAEEANSTDTCSCFQAFLVDWSRFVPNKKVYGYMLVQKGTNKPEEIIRELNLRVIDVSLSHEEAVKMLGNIASDGVIGFVADNALPLIGGLNFNVGFSKGIGASLKVEVKGDNLTVGVGISFNGKVSNGKFKPDAKSSLKISGAESTVLEGSSFSISPQSTSAMERAMEDAIKRIKGKDYSKSSSKWGISIEVAGYITLKLADDSVQVTGGKIVGTLEVKYTYENYFVVGVVPVKMELEVSVKGEVKFIFKADDTQKPTMRDHDDLEEVSAKIKAKIEVFGGVSVGVLTVGAYGSFEFGIGMSFVDNFRDRFTLTEAYLALDFGLRVEVDLLFTKLKYSISLLDLVKQIFPVFDEGKIYFYGSIRYDEKGVYYSKETEVICAVYTVTNQETNSVRECTKYLYKATSANAAGRWEEGDWLIIDEQEATLFPVKNCYSFEHKGEEYRLKTQRKIYTSFPQNKGRELPTGYLSEGESIPVTPRALQSLAYLPDSYQLLNSTEALAEQANEQIKEKLYRMADGTVVMLYRGIVTDKMYDAYNYRKLMCKIQLPNGNWSEAFIIDDNGYNDEDFVAVEWNGKFVVLYGQANAKVQETMSTTEYAACLDVKYAILDLAIILANGSTSDVIVDTVNADNTLDHMLRLAVVNGKLTAVWVKNTENNIFGTSNGNYVNADGDLVAFGTTANQLWYSVLGDEGWSEPALLKDGLAPIVDYDVNSEGIVAYIVDNDGNLGTDGRSLHCIDIATCVECETNDGKDYVSVHAEGADIYCYVTHYEEVGIDADGREVTNEADAVDYVTLNLSGIYRMKQEWSAGAEQTCVVADERLTASTIDITGDYTVLYTPDGEGNDAFYAIVFVAERNGGDASTLCALFYDPIHGEWGEQVDLVPAQNGRYVDFFSVVLVDDVIDASILWSTIHKDAEGNTDYTYEGVESTLVVETDVAMDAFTYDYNAFIVGRDSLFALTLTNHSAHPVALADILFGVKERTSGRFVHGYAAPVALSALAQTELTYIRSGETITLSILLNVGGPLDLGGYTAVVYLATDVDGANDACNFRLAYADIYLTAKPLVIGTQNRLLISVYNDGDIDIGDDDGLGNDDYLAGMLYVVDQSLFNAEGIAEKYAFKLPIAKVEANKSRFYTVSLEEIFNYISDRCEIITICFVPTNDGDEMNKGNNYFHISLQEFCKGQNEKVFDDEGNVNAIGIITFTEGSSFTYSVDKLDNGAIAANTTDLVLDYTRDENAASIALYSIAVDGATDATLLARNSGSTDSIVLTADALNKLTLGEHVLGITFADGDKKFTRNILVTVVKSYYTVTWKVHGEQDVTEILATDTTPAHEVADYEEGGETHAFMGWRDSYGEEYDFRMSNYLPAVKANVTYTALYVNQTEYYGYVTTHTVTWVVDGEESVEYVKHGTTPATRENPTLSALSGTYSFTGWDVDGDGVVDADVFERVITADVRYVAKFTWEGHAYTVTTVVDDGAQRYENVAHNADFALTVPEKASTYTTDYVFLGWDSDADGEVDVAAEQATVKVKGNMTLAAIFDTICASNATLRNSADVSVAWGGVFTTVLSLADIQRTANATFVLAYDAAVVTLQGYVAQAGVTVAQSNGRITITVSGLTDVTDKALVALTFKAQSTLAKGNYQYLQLLGKDIGGSAQFAGFGIYEYGDVDMDGEVNVLDLMAIKRYMLGQSTLDEAQMQYANVNGDKDADGNAAINVLDLMLLKRHMLDGEKLGNRITVTYDDGEAQVEKTIEIGTETVEEPVLEEGYVWSISQEYIIRPNYPTLTADTILYKKREE